MEEWFKPDLRFKQRAIRLDGKYRVIFQIRSVIILKLKKLMYSR